MYYKVTKLNGARFTSMVATGQWQNTYKPGVTKYFRRANKTFVCDDLGLAKSLATWSYLNEVYIIWEVECINPVVKFTFDLTSYQSKWHNVWKETSRYFLDPESNFPLDVKPTYIPTRVVLADAVKLIVPILAYQYGILIPMPISNPNFQRAFNKSTY